jgi:tetratricopeptide (TPR) repeat protein
MDAHAAEIARLEGIMAGDPGAPAFPALAEAQRRAGRPAQAERIARAGLRVQPEHVAGRVALGLALLDLGRVEDARSEFALALEATPDHVLARAALGGAASEAPDAGAWDDSPLARIGEGEIEAAVAAARAEREAMLDADRVALAALREVEEPEAEPAAEEDALARVADRSSPFATRTVADLLERQGDRARAESVRRAAAARRGAGSEREVLIVKLEAWLARLRREAR